MKLYLRTQAPGERREHVQYDHCFDVHSQAEWQARIDAVGKDVITSVLRPTQPRFALRGRHLLNRSHPHETRYAHDPAVNESYRQAAERLAARIEEALRGSRRCLVYLPLRGALPIWRAVKRYFRELAAPGRLEEYHAVTSSFVMYPRELGHDRQARRAGRGPLRQHSRAEAAARLVPGADGLRPSALRR
jgi:hypothetical protein